MKYQILLSKIIEKLAIDSNERISFPEWLNSNIPIIYQTITKLLFITPNKPYYNNNNINHNNNKSSNNIQKSFLFFVCLLYN